MTTSLRLVLPMRVALSCRRALVPTAVFLGLIAARPTVAGAQGIGGGFFADLGGGARQVATGGALPTMADDAYAVWANPAGLGTLGHLAVGSTYTWLLPGLDESGLRLATAGAVVPLGIVGQTGFGLRYFSLGSLANAVTAVGGYGRRLGSTGLAVGGAVKLLRWSVTGDDGSLSHTTVSFDLGLHQTLVDLGGAGNELRLGLVVRDPLEPSTAANGSADGKLARQIEGGVGYRSQRYGYLSSLGLGYTAPDGLRLRVGSELRVARGETPAGRAEVQLRVGGDLPFESAARKTSRINGGVGLGLGPVQVDYTYVYTTALTDLGGAHRLGLSYSRR